MWEYVNSLRVCLLPLYIHFRIPLQHALEKNEALSPCKNINFITTSTLISIFIGNKHFTRVHDLQPNGSSVLYNPNVTIFFSFLTDILRHHKTESDLLFWGMWWKRIIMISNSKCSSLKQLKLNEHEKRPNEKRFIQTKLIVRLFPPPRNSGFFWSLETFFSVQNQYVNPLSFEKMQSNNFVVWLIFDMIRPPSLFHVFIS